MNSTFLELERIAQSYHLNEDIPDRFIETLCQQHCCRWLAGFLAPESRVLELGFGDGITLSQLSPLVSQYTVLEGAASLSELIQRDFPKVQAIHTLFEMYEAAEPYRTVLALHVLEHVSDPVNLLRHMRGWLDNRSELIIVVPNSESLHRRLAVEMALQPKLDTLSPRDKIVGHQRVYDIVMLRKHLHEAGYEVVEEKGFFLKTLPNSMMLDYSPELIMGLNQLADQLPVTMAANLGVRARLKRSA